MIVTRKVIMNLDRPDPRLRIAGVQGDQNSRAVCFLLQENGLKWQIPGDLQAAVWYRKADGTGGVYDTLEDGRPAWESKENALTIFLAPQMLTAPGDVQVQLALHSGARVLHSFQFVLEVTGVLAEIGDSQDYFCWRSAFLPQISEGEPGQLLQIREIDSQGRVVRMMGVDAPTGTGGTQAALPLEGKTVVCFGDSLFGKILDDTSVSAALAECTGAKVYNVGFQDTRMSEDSRAAYVPFALWALADAVSSRDFSWQEEQASAAAASFPGQLAVLKRIDFSQVDMVVIHSGIGDFRDGAMLDDGSDDCSVVCGALRHTIATLLEAYPKLLIFISLPGFRIWEGTDGNAVDSDSFRNGNGQTQPELVEALRAVAAQFHLPVIDGYYALGINACNAGAFLADGAEYNAEGRKRVGAFLGANLVSRQTTARSDGYSRSQMDAILGGYITEVAALVGGDA